MDDLFGDDDSEHENQTNNQQDQVMADSPATNGIQDPRTVARRDSA